MKTSAINDGFGRAIRSKRYILLIFLINIAIAALMGFTVSQSIESSLGSSASSETLVDTFDPLWYDGFKAETKDGLAATFDPRNSGLGGVLDAIDSFLSGDIFKRPVAILGAAAMYLVLWSFFTGGLLWRFQLMRRGGTFFGSCGRFFPRFLLLGLLGGVGYYSIFHWGLPPLEDWITEQTREVVDERWMALITLARYVVLVLALALVHVLVTYSRIITVVRDVPLWMTILTPFRALWFFVCHPLRVSGIYLLLGLLFALLVTAYGAFWHFYPDMLPTGSTGGILLALGSGQVLVLGRIFLRCLSLSSHMALYENIRVLPPLTPAIDEQAEANAAEEEAAAFIAAAGVGGAVGGATSTYDPVAQTPSDEAAMDPQTSGSAPSSDDSSDGIRLAAATPQTDEPTPPPYVAAFDTDEKIVQTFDTEAAVIDGVADFSGEEQAGVGEENADDEVDEKDDENRAGEQDDRSQAQL